MSDVDEAPRQRVGHRLEEILGRYSGYDAKMVARFLWGAWNGVVSTEQGRSKARLLDGSDDEKP